MKDILKQKLDPQFSGKLPADKNPVNNSRQVHEACYSYVKPLFFAKPELIHVSKELLTELDLEVGDDAEFLKVMSGQQPFKEFESYAMCYGGHQFGNWAGQLGDGRAINIAEVEVEGTNWKFQLKGSGPTPYSRGSDGLAVLRSSIREYLCSEAMYHLGVPTTRALTLVKTGEMVTRDMLYNGNPKDEPGAIVCRLSPSFVRFGSFEIFTSRKDMVNLQKLLDYTILQHYPHLGAPAKSVYVEFFKELADRTMEMVIHWQRVGFVHGVMNTDNMSALGLTIDYGPYGWLENYDPNWTPNTTDAQHKRYSYGNQPSIAFWNLTQLANALYPLIEEAEPLELILNDYRQTYFERYKKMMLEKLGLYHTDEVSTSFIDQLEELLKHAEVDFTLFFREISTPFEFNTFWKVIEQASYLDSTALIAFQEQWKIWFQTYRNLVEAEALDREERAEKMKAVNPKYVLRNYMAQLAIDAAEKGNYKLIDELYHLLLNPYAEQTEHESWYAKRPDWAKNKVGCSMLSCSS